MVLDPDWRIGLAGWPLSGVQSGCQCDVPADVVCDLVPHRLHHEHFPGLPLEGKPEELVLGATHLGHPRGRDRVCLGGELVSRHHFRHLLDRVLLLHRRHHQAD